MRNRRRGTTLIEFTLTGIPIMFLSVSVFECSLAMFEYESMANAVAIAARYAASHGATCAQSPNSCTVTIGSVANVIAGYSWIISSANMTVKFTDNSGTTTCILNTCQTRTAQFPSGTGNANAVGNTITINLTHTITNPLPMYWPGAANGDDAGYTLGANSIQVIQF
jgi:Flp pilus assembly protein TadG